MPTEQRERVWKYRPLKDYLEGSEKTTEVLSFEEIEDILGSLLPEAAHVYQAWWAPGTHTQQKAWTEPGWRVACPKDAIKSHEVTFHKKSILLREIFIYFNCPLPYNVHNKNKLEDAYEKMIKQYDPSKLKDMDMAQELIKLAEAKTKEINDMYERALAYFNAA